MGVAFDVDLRGSPSSIPNMLTDSQPREEISARDASELYILISHMSPSKKMSLAPFIVRYSPSIKKLQEHSIAYTYGSLTIQRCLHDKTTHVKKQEDGRKEDVTGTHINQDGKCGNCVYKITNDLSYTGENGVKKPIEQSIQVPLSLFPCVISNILSWSLVLDRKNQSRGRLSS